MYNLYEPQSLCMCRRREMRLDMMKNQIQKLRRRAATRLSLKRGQGLVEFALVLPVLVLLLIAVMEFGYFFFVYSTVNNAAREAVRYGSAVGQSANGVPFYQDCAGIREVVTRIGRYANIQDDDVTISFDSGPGTTSTIVCQSMEASHSNELVLNQRIIVEVDVNYYPIILRPNMPTIPIHALSARTLLISLELDS